MTTNGWFKSSFSNGNATCVEVRFDGDLVSVRDSKHPAGGRLTVTASEWTEFLGALTHSGSVSVGPLIVAGTPVGWTIRAVGQDPVLSFTDAEWRACLAGVHAREFDVPAAVHG